MQYDMKPHYEDEAVTIYCGDCRDILPGLPKVDLVLTDPPYVGLTGGYDRADFMGSQVGGRGKNSVSIGDPWSASFDWAGGLPDSLGVAVFCTHHSAPETAIAFSAMRRVAPPTGKNVPRFRSEFIWLFASGPGLAWDRFTDTVIDLPRIAVGCFESAEYLGHPTQKPQHIMSWLLLPTEPGQLILDPFMGSGTTLRAAKDLGRKAIGIELEERYCEIAAKRMAQEVLAL